jgi:type I restriction enzyme M protein
VIAWSTIAADAKTQRRLDAEFFDPRVEKVTDALKNNGSEPLGSWVISAGRGATPEYAEGGEVKVVKTANIRRFSLAELPSQFVTEEFGAANPRALIPEDALLVTATGVGSAGRTFVKLDSASMMADAHVTVLPVKTNSEAAFLCAYLQSPAGIQQLLRTRRGSSRQIEIYPEDVLSVQVPDLPPERREAIARRWMTAARSVQETATARLDAERRIEELVGGEWEEEMGAEPAAWERELSVIKDTGNRLDPESQTPGVRGLQQKLVQAGGVPLSALVLGSRRGVQPDAYDDDGPVRVIKSKDVHFPELDLSSCARAEDTGDWPFLVGGELLINTTGQGTLGRSTVLSAKAAQRVPSVSSIDVHVLEINSAQAIPEYVAIFLNSRIGRTLTAALQTGSSGQQHLYPTHFAAIPVPMRLEQDGSPDLTWQGEIVEIAEARRAAVDEAQGIGEELDKEFIDHVGVAVDLSIVPV